MEIQLILNGWLLSVIVLCFVKLKWAASLFLAYVMLVPYINLGLPSVGTGDNLIKLIMAVCLWKDAIRNKKKISFVPFTPFIIYFVVSLLMMPFQDGIPFGTMIDTWRQDVMNILFFPIVVWNLILINPSSITLFRNTMIVCIIIAIGYGFFLTTMDGINPYAMYFSLLSESDIDYESYYKAEGEGRLWGRISSVFIHPMTFALFIGLTLIYLYYVRNKMNIIVNQGLIVATIVMAIMCGVRSVLGGLMVALAYYMVIQRNFKLLIKICVIGFLGIFLISLTPELSNYLGSIMDVHNTKTEVHGSSIEMRLDQLNGAMDEASENPLFGLGYKWTEYYRNTKGDHPLCLAFESLVFVIICNSGFLGIVLWFYMILKYFSINRKMKIHGLPIVNTLIVFYVSYSLITGEYGYMKIFLLFYTLMLGESQYNHNKNEKKSTSNRLLFTAVPSDT